MIVAEVDGSLAPTAYAPMIIPSMIAGWRDQLRSGMRQVRLVRVVDDFISRPRRTA
jgi:hypothetical protein